MNQAATHLSQYLDRDSQTIEAFDAELWSAMSAETVRQEEHIELIASENYCSPRVLEAQGSVLTNKYAEGFPGKRYYGGCEFVDQAETLAIERAKALFGADFANVQPHSGSPRWGHQNNIWVSVRPGTSAGRAAAVVARASYRRPEKFTPKGRSTFHLSKPKCLLFGERSS